ncbi:MAG: hypothetical protein ABIA63_07115 [bacterium]
MKKIFNNIRTIILKRIAMKNTLLKKKDINVPQTKYGAFIIK